MVQHDQLAIAILVLDGETNAHRVLADLLEESGDPGLAQWARCKKPTMQKRLKLILSLLPPATLLELGIAFYSRSPRADTDHQAALKAVRAWDLDSNLAKLEEPLSQLSASAPYQQTDLAAHFLVQLVRNSWLACQPDAQADRGHLQRARSATGRIAHHIRELRRSPLYTPHTMLDWHDELDWQVKRTRKQIRQLLNSTATP